MATTGQVVFSGVNGQGNVSIFQSPIRSWELPLTGGAWPTAGYRITHVQWAVGNVLMNQPKRECHVVLAGDAGKEIDAFKPYLLAYAAGSYYSLSRPGAALESEMKGKSSISLGFYSTKGDLSENTGNVFSIRGGCTLSLTVTYELLFQASPFSLDKSTMDMGQTVTVNVGATDVNGGFTHTATLTMGGQSVTASRTGPGAIQLTVPASWYGLLPTSVSGTATVTVTTAGAGQTGSASKPLTLTIPASVKPTAGTLTAEGISPYWGLYVQGVSRARLTLSGYAAGAGASGVSVSIAGGGYSGTGASLTTGALKTAGAVTFTATVMDSRGRTATATVSLTVTAYNPPKITSLGVARCTADGTVDEAAGTYVKITLGYTWSAIGSNAIDGDIYIGGVKTQSNAALPASGEAFAAAFGGELAIAAAYPIKVMIYDGIHTRAAGASISAEAILQSVRRVLNFYPSADSGIGVGKMATGEKRVELAEDWELYAYGRDIRTLMYKQNLLDNSDFRNPVNQRGLNSYTAGWAMSIDRWYIANSNPANTCTLTISGGGITLTNNGAGGTAIVQRLQNLKSGVIYTLVCYTSDGEYIVGTVEDHVESQGFHQCTLWVTPGTMIIWAALYEGEYTADTLPPYVSKGYAVELAECKRYYQHIVRNAYCYAVANNVGYYVIEDFPEMRVSPTIVSSLLHNGIGTNDTASVANSIFRDRIGFVSSGVLLDAYKSAIYDCYLSADL